MMKIVIITEVVNTCIGHGVNKLAFTSGMAINNEGLSTISNCASTQLKGERIVWSSYQIDKSIDGFCKK